ncbi:MAG: glycosyltransferase family 39 protein [Planctomycetota bacterium]|nr:glycosyltransferase family 39 protein [Planctomycetota bacterium]
MLKPIEYSKNHCWPSVAVGTLFITLAGAISLARIGPTEFVIDFSDPHAVLPGDSFTKFVGWESTSGGLGFGTAPDSLITFPVQISRFREFLFDLEVTEAGKGKLKAGLMLLPASDPGRIKIPAQRINTPRWKFSFGWPHKEFDASSLVNDGPVNLLQVCPEGGQCLMAVRKNGDADGAVLKGIRIGSAPNRFAWLLLPPFAVLCLVSVWQVAVAFPRYKPPHATAVVAALLVMIAWAVPIGLLEFAVVIGLLLALAALIPCLFNSGQRQNSTWILLALIAFLGACYRWDFLNQMRFEPPAPDALRYREIASDMWLVYDGQEREPLFILASKLSIILFGNSDSSLRVLTYILSVVLIPALYLTGRQLWGVLPGMTAAILIAGSGEWAWSGARGMRLELFTITLLPMTWAAFTTKPPEKGRHVLWLGLSAAAATMARLTSLWFCLAAGAFALWRRGWDRRSFLKFTVLAAGPILPYLVYCGFKFGDPMYAVNRHIKFYRNYELVNIEGGITEEQMNRDAYGGPDVSSFEFFFRQLSPAELTERTVRAFTTIFVGEHCWTRLAGKSHVLYWLIIASYFVVAASPYRLMWIWVALLIGPIAWLYSGTTGPEARIVMHTAALVYLFVGYSLQNVVDRLSRPDSSE